MLSSINIRRFISYPKALENVQAHSLDFLAVMSGYLILSVIFNHVRIEYYNANYSWATPLFHMNLLDAILEIVRMPPVSVFVFVSGFRFQYSLLRYKTYERPDGQFLYRRYVRKRFKRLMIPYAIWTLVYLVIAYGIGLVHSVTSGAEPPVFVRLVDIPALITGWGQVAYQLWFIPMLFFNMVIVIYVRFVLRRPTLSYALYGLFLFLQFVAPQVNARVMPYGEWLGYIINLEVGIVCAQAFYKRGALPSLFMVALVWLAVAVLRLIPLPAPFPNVFRVAAYFISPLFLYALTFRLIPSSIQRRNWLYELGKNVFPIFIIHAPFLTAWIVTFFSKSGLYNFWTLIPIALVTAFSSFTVYRFLLWVVPKRVFDNMF